MSPRQNTHYVWNVSQGYMEHIGTLFSCQNWLRNVRDSGFALDEYSIEERPTRPNVPSTKR